MKRIAVLAVAFAIVTISAGTAIASAATNKPAEVKKVATATSAKTEEKAAPVAETKPAPVMYTVVEGDFLSKIADANGTTWVRIYNANENIVNPDVINPGDQLRIPTAEETLADRALPQPVVVAAPVQTTYRAAAAAPAAASYPVDGNSAKAYIYARESGNNPNATNPNGCYGIGQDCNGVLRAQCGADYACQDAYFTNYAIRRYGSWENALAFWQANHWW